MIALPSPDIRDYLLFVLFTGVRREEALGLKWTQVDLISSTITILDPKNHIDHVLPLSDYLQDLLHSRHEDHESGYVFADTRGRSISNFRYAQASIKKAGVAFCIHDLRRTFATVAESLDIPAYALKRLLNHANGTDVTAGYIVANPERLREPMQKITDYLLKAGGLKATATVLDIHQRKEATRQPSFGEEMNYHDIITIEPGKRSGKPCIRGLRITVSDVLEYLAFCMSADDIVEDFPELTKEDIQACLRFAAGVRVSLISPMD